MVVSVNDSRLSLSADDKVLIFSWFSDIVNTLCQLILFISVVDYPMFKNAIIY